MANTLDLTSTLVERHIFVNFPALEDNRLELLVRQVTRIFLDVLPRKAFVYIHFLDTPLTNDEMWKVQQLFPQVMFTQRLTVTNPELEPSESSEPLKHSLLG